MSVPERDLDSLVSHQLLYHADVQAAHDQSASESVPEVVLTKQLKSIPEPEPQVIFDIVLNEVERRRP